MRILKTLWGRADAVVAAARSACLHGPRRCAAPGGCALLQLQALLRVAGRQREGQSSCSFPFQHAGVLTMQGGRVERVPAGGGVVQRDS